MEARYYRIAVNPQRKGQLLTETEKKLDPTAFCINSEELRHQNEKLLKELADDPFWPRQVDYIINL